MSVTEVKEAADKLKNVHRDMVLWENNLASLQTKVTDLMRQKELLQKQIDEKVANANIMMSEQRGKIEVERAHVTSEREKLEAGKKEIATQIDALRTEKSAFNAEKEAARVTMEKAKNLRGNVDQFIVAVQRAYGVLG